MGTRHGTRALLFPVLLLLGLPGCQVFQRRPPLPIQVRDAETKQPIAGAEVRAWYPMRRYGSAQETATVTAADGMTLLPLTADSAGMMVEAQAHGYLFGELSVPSEVFTEHSSPPTRVVVELFAEPAPSVELIVPNGFHGVVKAELRYDESLSFPPGQRRFCYEVSRGSVHIQGPLFFRLISPADYRARYQDGRPISSSADQLEIGLHWLKCEGDDQYFVVGTQSEFEAIRADLKIPPGSRAPQSGGQKGGGRHHKGGSTAPADPQN
jgi:hypothetical protein